jgi:uncharacterized membrane protein YhaH (DUF805 family)
MSLYRLLTDFDGRIGLPSFWFGSAVVAATLYAVQFVAPLVSPEHARQIVAIAGAFALFPWAALAAKRAHDRGSSSLFGILLVCAIVLPAQLRLHLPVIWAPSLQTITLIAWVVALIDLGLLPGRPDSDTDNQVAARDAGAKAAG